MLTNRLLLRRTARSQNRGGFTLVELLVVIGIIAILAGVALGPITNGIKQAKHNGALQTGRQIGQVCFSYFSDIGTYPADTAAYKVAQDLINSNYVTDSSLFIVSNQSGVSAAVPVSGVFTLANTNCSWTFTCLTAATGGGLTTNASDLIPLVYFNNGPGNSIMGTSFTPNSGSYTATKTALTSSAPFGTDGTAVFYKGNNAAYLKAGTGGTVGIVANFISANCTDTTAYAVAP